MSKWSMLSALLHSLVLILFIDFNSMSENKNKGQSSGANKILEIELETPKEPGISKPKPPIKCQHDSWYGGIGVYVSESNKEMIISNVIKGYPAYFSGVQARDKIIKFESENGEIQGDPGTKVKLTLERNGKILVKNIVRGRICLYGKE